MGTNTLIYTQTHMHEFEVDIDIVVVGFFLVFVQLTCVYNVWIKETSFIGISLRAIKSRANTQS